MKNILTILKVNLCKNNIKKMEEKVMKIEIPEGYEIDKEQSSFEKIVFKKKEQEVKTWDDLINRDLSSSSKYITNWSFIHEAIGDKFSHNDKNCFIDEKHAKSALAMAQISQLMPYYGGPITDEEWEDLTAKYVIVRYNKEIRLWYNINAFNFLAFHTKEQRDMFYKYNESLIKDYLMID